MVGDRLLLLATWAGYLNADGRHRHHRGTKTVARFGHRLGRPMNFHRYGLLPLIRGLGFPMTRGWGFHKSGATFPQRSVYGFRAEGAGSRAAPRGKRDFPIATESSSAHCAGPAGWRETDSSRTGPLPLVTNRSAAQAAAGG
jgi:hypothetical protein